MPELSNALINAGSALLGSPVGATVAISAARYALNEPARGRPRWTVREFAKEAQCAGIDRAQMQYSATREQLLDPSFIVPTRSYVYFLSSPPIPPRGRPCQKERSME
jgi:hypothetical protein